jgi:hypothetical protein
VGAGKAHQCLDVPVGEHFGGLTGRAAVTARHQHAEAEPLVDQWDQNQSLGPAAGDAGQGSADPVGVLDQPHTGPEQLPDGVVAVLDTQLPLVRGKPDTTRHLHDALAVVEQDHDDVGAHPLGDLGCHDLGKVAFVELGWLAAEGRGQALDGLAEAVGVRADRGTSHRRYLRLGRLWASRCGEAAPVPGPAAALVPVAWLLGGARGSFLRRPSAAGGRHSYVLGCRGARGAGCWLGTGRRPGRIGWCGRGGTG